MRWWRAWARRSTSCRCSCGVRRSRRWPERRNALTQVKAAGRRLDQSVQASFRPHRGRGVVSTMIRYCAIALGGMALTLSACVYPPLPDPMAGLQNCHPFTQDITVQGHTVAGYGVQCVQADGTSIVAIPPQATPPSAAEVMQNLPPPTYADPNAYAYYA